MVFMHTIDIENHCASREEGFKKKSSGTMRAILHEDVSKILQKASGKGVTACLQG